MNIQISDSWLREFIKTKATPEQIGEYLSLCSQSVEKIIKDGDDHIYDIEITTNRPDCLSVYGMARELSAILPRFGVKATFIKPPAVKIPRVENGLPLQVKITKADLCPRFTALVFDNITIKPSPLFVQKRLNQSGIRALNNVIDISNYLMLELGQPMHTFDYDKILKHKMILRESNQGEEIITLDGQKRKLKEGIIIVEDGEGRIIDLCGIMGAKNSETDEKTSRVLLFVQTYNPMKIRKACQLLGFRSEAASRFEKSVDMEGVMPAMERATLLFKQWCNSKVGSKLLDIYPNPVKEKTVVVLKKEIDLLSGISIELEEVNKILSSLGFKTKINPKKEEIKALVPHYRNGDIEIPEDLVEEITRLYGYHNLPNILPPISTINYNADLTFYWEEKIKTALKFWGFTETVTYSMVSRAFLTKAGLTAENHLKIANPLTEELVYLRTSLIPNILEVAAKNSGEYKEVKVFEMSNVYLPQGKNKLPEEKMRLTIAVTGNKFFELKGILESLAREIGIGISNFDFSPLKTNCTFFTANSAQMKIGASSNNEIGIIGEIGPKIIENFNLSQKIIVADISLEKFLKFASNDKKYLPISKYPPIIEDLSFEFSPKTLVGPVIERIKELSPLIVKVELIDTFNQTKTLRITYQSEKENLTEEEVKKIRQEVIGTIESKFNVLLKKKE